jgi:hypothetical protein
MEVGKGLVHPCQTMLDDIEIDASSYAMVKVDMVHKNLKDLKLEVPLDDMTLTLRDAVTRRVQWRMTSIDVDPSVATLALNIASQPNITPASILLTHTHLCLQFESSHVRLKFESASISNSRAVTSVSTSDLEYPYTWLDVALCCHAKGDKECTRQVSTAAAKDVIQGNKGQATIQIDDSYDID